MQSWSISKKSIVHETQSDDSWVSICQYGIERDSGDVSQRKGYTHSSTFTSVIRRREKSIQIKLTDDKSRTANNDTHEEIGLVNCARSKQNTW